MRWVWFCLCVALVLADHPWFGWLAAIGFGLTYRVGAPPSPTRPADPPELPADAGPEAGPHQDRDLPF